MTPMPYFRTYPGSLSLEQETEDMMDIDQTCAELSGDCKTDSDACR